MVYHKGAGAEGNSSRMYSYFPVYTCMRVVLKDTGSFVLRFDAKEEVLEELKNFCEKKQFHAGWFSAIGSASEVTIAFYNPRTKSFEERTMTEPLEIVSLTGNVSSLNGHIALHAHGSFADYGHRTWGGHASRVVVSATCELLLTPLAGTLKRTPDLDTRLNLLR